MVDGVPDFAFGGGRNTVAGVERGIDGGFKGEERHRSFLGSGIF
jgi:hypothetical protein